jgi:hypothetical protein
MWLPESVDWINVSVTWTKSICESLWTWSVHPWLISWLPKLLLVFQGGGGGRERERERDGFGVNYSVTPYSSEFRKLLSFFVVYSISNAYEIGYTQCVLKCRLFTEWINFCTFVGEWHFDLWSCCCFYFFFVFCLSRFRGRTKTTCFLPGRTGWGTPFVDVFSRYIYRSCS